MFLHEESRNQCKAENLHLGQVLLCPHPPPPTLIQEGLTPEANEKLKINKANDPTLYSFRNSTD